jgi:hypothetical protein
MIKFDLKCNNNHIFETWFRNSATYDEQVRDGEVICAICGSVEIEKALMTPSVPKKGNRQSVSKLAKAEKETQQFAETLKAVKEIRKKVEESCDDVGTAFAEEARKIHYGEVETRGIYGQATVDESKELIDEGVAVLPLPWAPNNDT